MAWRTTLRSAVDFKAVYAASAVVSAFGDPGREQGLTPTSWDSSRAVPFAVNFVVFVAVAPFVVDGRRAPVWRGAPDLFSDTAVVLRDLLGWDETRIAAAVDPLQPA